MVNSLLFTIQLTFISRLKENTTEISSPLRHWAQEILLGPMNGGICIAGSFSSAAAGEAVGTHCPSLPALPWASGPALREQQLWTQLAADVESPKCDVCQRGPRKSRSATAITPRGLSAREVPAHGQRSGAGAARAGLRSGAAGEAGQGHGCCCGTGLRRATMPAAGAGRSDTT